MFFAKPEVVEEGDEDEEEEEEDEAGKTRSASTSAETEEEEATLEEGQKASMSASDPNLTQVVSPTTTTTTSAATAEAESTVSLLETFAAVARRKQGTGGYPSSLASANSRNQAVSSAAAMAAAAGGSSGIFGHGTKSVSSLVRLALSSNFPSGLLNAAQSYPSLGSGAQARPPTTSSTATAAQLASQMSESDQVSLEEFLESCRATSLLAELEDEEELPEAEDDDNEDEDDDDEDDYDENFDEEGFENAAASAAVASHPRHHGGRHHHHGRHPLMVGSSGRRKTWDDDHVLKRKFSALIPAFDPRPGRTNVNQTSDFDVSPPSTEDPLSAIENPSSAPVNAPPRGATATPAPTPPPPPPRDDSTPPPTAPGLVLTLRGPGLPGVQDVELDLTDPDWTIFRAVQTIMQTSMLGSKEEKLRRVWEPTYIISYREMGVDRSASRQQSSEADQAEHEARRSPSVPPPMTFLPQLPVLSSSQCTMDEVLQLLRQLYIIAKRNDQTQDQDPPALHLAEVFNSKKITNKLVQQIQDPLILSANAMPDWCEELTSSCPMLFPFDTRLLFFQCTAFGASRSIVWLQNQRDQQLERARGRGRTGAVAGGGVHGGMEDFHEFRVGRIKHERVKVPRGPHLLAWAIQVSF